MPRPLLTADWRHLILVTYHAPAHLLAPHLPHGVELELFDGRPAVSLVALTFSRTRLWGALPLPTLQRFGQWNLRTYVRPTHGPDSHRGVVFLREFVPHPALVLAGRALNDPFHRAPVLAEITTTPTAVTARYTLTHGGHTHALAATAPGPLTQPPEDSLEHRLKERFFSYTRTRGRGGGGTRRFHVWHPAWRTYTNAQFTTALDWPTLHSPPWSIMQPATPFSTIFAEGSPAKLHAPQTL